MKPKDRYKWLLDKITKEKRVDVLNSYFVDDYTEAAKPTRIGYQPWGANTVPQLGRDLSAMYKLGMLDRYTVGLIEHEYGFPNWVYSYRIKAATDQPRLQR